MSNLWASRTILWFLKDLKVGEPILIEGIFYYAVDEFQLDS